MRFLSIQSFVAYGHVGNSAATFPLQRLGHEVWPVLTVVFSNHTGYGEWRGPLLPPEDVRAVVTGIEERGVLDTCDAVLSGYLGGPGICEVVVDAVERVKRANPEATYTCDPVMGNATSGCFVDPAIPPIIREQVVPHADVITPNQFELGFLTDTEPDTARVDARLGRRRHGDGAVDGARDVGAATRPARGHHRDAGGHPDGAWSVRTPRLPIKANGSGDLTAALFTAHLRTTDSPAEALGLTASSVVGVLQATIDSGERELQIVLGQDAIASPADEFEVEQVR